MSRRKKASPAKCGTCRAPIVWKSWHGGGWRSFQPRPVDPRTHIGRTAYPVEGMTVWRRRQLIEELMGRHGYSDTDAEDEIRDMTWMVPHECPLTDPTPGGAP